MHPVQSLTRSTISRDKPEGSLTRLESNQNVTVRRILLPLDFSEGSRKAFEYAVRFTGQFRAELVLLHVFEPVPPSLKIFEIALAESGFREQAANELKEWQNRVPPGLSSNAVLREGRTAHQGILEAAEEFEIDLIVIGLHKHNSLEGMLTSTAEQVFKHAHCAVLLAAP